MFTALNDPNASAVYSGTFVTGISGSTIYGYYFGTGDIQTSFSYDAGVFTDLNFPNSTQTEINGASGNTIFGYYNATNGVQNGFVATAVPEPSTYAFLGISTLAMLIALRKRNKRERAFRLARVSV